MNAETLEMVVEITRRYVSAERDRDALLLERDELKRVLRDANAVIMNHHNFGVIERLYKEGISGSCMVCERSGIIETIDEMVSEGRKA